ncbi:hypothetical protein F5884DRAFT_425217 [Xylogone sp. PMI_703]|nr:hypothetical protein F5884DRAFT_425217 [Xylogone sp. PMI_703]
MATIKPIEGRTVHQIQSGQVIVDLCSVVKELVENSLDAGATNIDVRFKNQGLDSIEVQDNGNGISRENYETIALKHYTSKLSSYSDLENLQTFGFRGEALSSLCALSNFSMITCLAADAPKGSKLEFEVSGKLKDTSMVAAQKGTTVIVENLFKTLPVRRRELERNIKREWNRVIGVLGQYACIQTGVKLTVTQQHPKGKKTVLFSTKGNRTTRENIANVFGAKALASLVPLDLKLDLDPTDGPSLKPNTRDDPEKQDIRITGHISRPNYGEGRQTPDRQMFFVNGRPCGLPQFAKAFNEVYKSYNTHQSPFIFANIELDTHLYDVNVSPDKRTILLHEQSRMLESLKTALIELFESQDHTVPISQLAAKNTPSYKQLTIDYEKSHEKPTPKTLQHESNEEQDDSLGAAGSDGSSDEDLESVSITDFAPAAAAIRGKNVHNQDPKHTSSFVSRIAAETEFAKSKTTEETRSILFKYKQIPHKEVVIGGENTAPTDGAHDNGPDSDGDEEIQLVEKSVDALISADSDDEAAEPRQTFEGQGDGSLFVQPEPPIQSMASSTPRSSQSIADSFSKRSPFRNPPDIATIQIGDHTITSPIGGSLPKRQRIDISSPLKYNYKQTSTSSPLPSFRGRLSKRFAAPGSRETPAETQEEQEEQEEEEDNEDEVSSDDENVFESRNEDGETVTKLASSPKSATPGEPDDGLDGDDDEYIDEDDKKIREEEKVQQMIKMAEEESTRPSQENTMRANSLLKGGSKKKDATVSLVKTLNTSLPTIQNMQASLNEQLGRSADSTLSNTNNGTFDPTSSDKLLSLTISKDDFARMKVIGQFNLGFIITSRPSGKKHPSERETANDLFIIDQHASDEKYNFERLQATTLVQSQTLVHPKTLDLTALEEEIIMENLPILETNGFVVRVDTSGDYPVGRRCQLIGLPLSRETTFTIRDLEELISLLAESTAGSIPRPSKVRKMFAMRACRSSIMIGKTLNSAQMSKVVKHMGELDKPWNCPHGRPTMRHLCGLNAWDEVGWNEDMTGVSDLAGYIKRSR